MLWRVRAWTRALMRRDVVEREMQDELRDHIDRATERLVARGLSPANARAEALREFGNVGRIQEDARDARGVRWIEEIGQDVRYGTRGLVTTPAFTVVAVMSLVLGIGVNTTIFTVINGIMMAQVIDEPSSFVQIQQAYSYPTYERLRTNTPALSSLVVRSDERILLAPSAGDGEARLVAAELVSSNYFSALHATTTLGRTFGASDEREHVAVVNYRFWKASLGGDSSVLGRRFQLTNGTTFTVVGIGSRDFSGVRNGGPDVWLPIAMRPVLPGVLQGESRSDWFTAKDHAWLTLYGRLAAGQSPDAAQAQINQVIHQLSAEDSSFVPKATQSTIRAIAADARADESSERLANAALFGSALVVLLIACFNVAGLMLARATDRGREIAVRLCLGASRTRLLRQFITESAIIVGMSAVLGGVVSAWTLRALALSGKIAFLTDDDPERLAHALRPDWNVFGFSLALAAIGVVCCGLFPALHTTRLDLAGAVKADRRSFASRRSTVRAALTVAQIALSVVLLIGAALLTRSLTRARDLDLGFERDHVLSIRSSLNAAGIDGARAQSLSRDFEQRIAAIPGVHSIAHGDVPIVGGRFRTILTVNGVPQRGLIAAVTPSYFETLEIPIVRGRAFTDAELATHAQVAVVSEATARALWPNEDPLGKTIGVDPQKKGTLAPETRMPAAIVVGVARDAQMVNFGQIPPVYVYVPSARGEILVRVERDVAPLVSAIRSAWLSVVPNVPFVAITLADRIVDNGDLYDVRLFAGLASALGLLALLLASIGVFGLMAYSVARETRELGIRMALGASARDVLSLVIRRAGRVASVGIGVGVLGGIAATRVISGFLFGMSALDVVAYSGVAALILLVVLIACVLPARRATRIDPLLALKTE
jgi:predicted permease